MSWWRFEGSGRDTAVSRASETGLCVGYEVLEPDENGEGTEYEEYVGLMGEAMSGERKSMGRGEKIVVVILWAMMTICALNG